MLDRMLLLLIGNSLLTHYWGRIRFSTLFTSGLAMWLSLAYELWSDVPLMRISFKKDLVVHCLSLRHEMGISDRGYSFSEQDAEPGYSVDL